MSPAQHFFYWFFPIAVALGFFASFFIDADLYGTLFFNFMFPNTSVLEILTGVMLLITLGYCLYLIQTKAIWSNVKLRWWLIVYFIAVFYFVGEDQNWGQYYFNFTPSDYLLEHNKEKEINLHNMSTWFNQKPRLMVEFWVIIACIAVPLGWKWPVKKTKSFVPEVLWPSARMVPLAIASFVIEAPEKIRKMGIGENAQWLNIRYSELQELLFCFIMLLFLVEVKKNLQKKKAI